VLPTESNPTAVVPNPRPGAPIPGGWNIYTSAGSAKFVPGQTDVQVPIKVDVEYGAGGVIHEKTGEIPLKVSIRGSSAVFQTTTHYSGNR
jgi:hypothetical protein